MLIVGDNLLFLLNQYNIVDDKRCFDTTSLSLRLDRQIIRLEPPNDGELVYGRKIPEEWIKRQDIPDSGLLLLPGATVLGCSVEVINMPIGYYGILQTKGSLARLFVSVLCSDSQVDTGYQGRVTFEIANHSPHRVRMFANQKIAELLIVKTSTKSAQSYHGKYQGAGGPTVQEPGNI